MKNLITRMGTLMRDDSGQDLLEYGLLAALIAAYPSLSPEHLVGHSDIAPGRKSACYLNETGAH